MVILRYLSKTIPWRTVIMGVLVVSMVLNIYLIMRPPPLCPESPSVKIDKKPSPYINLLKKYQ